MPFEGIAPTTQDKAQQSRHSSSGYGNFRLPGLGASLDLLEVYRGAFHEPG